MNDQESSFIVKLEERQSWGSLSMIWVGSMICVPCLMIGGLLCTGMTLLNAFIATIIGYVIVIAYMSFMGMQSCDTGMPTVNMAAGALGKAGARYTISALLAIACIGWFGIQSNVCGSSFSAMMLSSTGMDIPVWLSSLLWGFIMLITAVYGYKALKILNYIAVPALVIVSIYGVIAAISKNGAQAVVDYRPAASMSMVSGISLAVATFALGGVISGDYSRYAKNRKDVVKSSIIGVLPAGAIMIMMGAVMSLVAGTYDISAVLSNLGLPAFGLIALVLATWTTNVVNAFSGGIAVSNFFNAGEKRRKLMTAIAGGLGAVLAAIGILGQLSGFLSILSSLLPPVAGVIIAHYWIVGKGKKENFNYTEGVNIAGMISFVIGAAIAYLTANVWIFFVSPVNGIIISMIAYLFLDKFLPKKAGFKEKAA